MHPASIAPGFGPSRLDSGYGRIVGRYGRYEVQSVLQQGGMGEVLLAELAEGPSRGLQVVIKRPAGLEQDEELEAMFLAELEVSSRLDHRNIVRVVDTPTVDGHRCLGLEFVRGRNLRQLLSACKKAKRSVPPAVALYIARELLTGLEYAHSYRFEDGRPLNLIHRDITPANVLLAFDGGVKLTDFGISKSAVSSAVTQVGVVKGTTRYLSPEQARGEPLTPRSDLFSVAVVLVELLTLRPLFGAAGSAALLAIGQGRHPPLEPLLPVPSKHIPILLEQALSMSPDERPQTAQEFRDALAVAEEQTFGRRSNVQDLVLFLRALFPEQVQASLNPHARETLSYLLNIYEGEVLTRPVSDDVAPLSNTPSESNKNPVGALPLDARDFEGTDPESITLTGEESDPFQYAPSTGLGMLEDDEFSDVTEIAHAPIRAPGRDALMIVIGVVIGIIGALFFVP